MFMTKFLPLKETQGHILVSWKLGWSFPREGADDLSSAPLLCVLCGYFEVVACATLGSVEPG